MIIYLSAEGIKKFEKALDDEIKRRFQKQCPHCKRYFIHTEVKSGKFCSQACEEGY